mmetsp:Transcript_24105/g.37849  ORF Transcript_24105/g.37849 Transcript_24105/m.37849 type:complete len:92 (-) Transcript_24105:29-304(-)
MLSGLKKFNWTVVFIETQGVWFQNGRSSSQDTVLGLLASELVPLSVAAAEVLVLVGVIPNPSPFEFPKPPEVSKPTEDPNPAPEGIKGYTL